MSIVLISRFLFHVKRKFLFRNYKIDMSNYSRDQLEEILRNPERDVDIADIFASLKETSDLTSFAARYLAVTRKFRITKDISGNEDAR